jgi:hypothetical protein
LRYSIPFSGLKECFAGSKILAREMSGTSSCIKRPRLGGSIVLVSPTNSLFIVCGGSGRAVVVDGCRCRQKGTVRLNCTLERRYPSHVGVNGTPTQSKGSVVAWLRPLWRASLLRLLGASVGSSTNCAARRHERTGRHRIRLIGVGLPVFLDDRRECDSGCSLSKNLLSCVRRFAVQDARQIFRALCILTSERKIAPCRRAIAWLPREI